MTIHEFKGLPGRHRAMLAIIIATLALTGCDTEKTHNLIDERAGEAQQQLMQAREPQTNAKPYNPLVVTDKVWSGNEALRMHRGVPLPTRFETSQGITLVSGEPLSLAEIATAITSQTGIPVRVADVGGGRAVASKPVIPSSGAQIPMAANLAGNPNNLNEPKVGNGAGNNSGESSSVATAGTMLVAYEGPLSGLLERVAGYFGVDWRYDGTSVSISRFETRVFLIEALPDTAMVQDSSQTSSTSGSSGSSGGGSSGGSSGGGGGGGSSGGSSGSSSSGNSSTGTLTQNTTYTANIKYWEELKEILANMLGGVGNVVISPSNGEVTVTTTPEIMRTVSDYLVQENKRLSRQIAINVEVYSVDVSRDSDFNVDFSAAIGKLGNVVNIKAVTGASAPTSVGSLTGLGELSIAILNPEHAHGGRIGDIFSALSTVGDTTTVAQFPLTTVNNRPVSRFVGTTQWFVPQITGSSTSTVGSTSTLGGSSATAQPITSGMTLQLTPRLLDDGRIVMQYSLNIQTITSIQCFNTCTGSSVTCNSTGASNTAGTACTLQEPITTNRSFIQQSVLRSGSTLVIGGVDQEDVAQNANGIGDAYNWLLGGGTSNSTGRTMVFIAISPQVLDPPAPEQGL